MSTTYILVADRARAKIVAVEADDARLVEVGCFANPDARRPARELERSRAPRVDESMGSQRHAIEPRTTTADKVSRRFARLLGATLREAHDARRFDRLMLVAPPRFLGMLAAALPKSVRACVADERALDLSACSPDELRDRLPAEWLGPPRAAAAPAPRVAPPDRSARQGRPPPDAEGPQNTR